MEKNLTGFMKWGKLVKDFKGDTFKLVDDMDANKETVKAVKFDSWKRYHLLRAWVRNWESNSMGFRDRFMDNIEDTKKEMECYVTELLISSLEPANKIRFITPDYKTRFEITDFDSILVNGEPRRAIYIDECHFQFEKGSCYHICEWAELCERNGIEVKQIAS